MERASPLPRKTPAPPHSKPGKKQRPLRVVYISNPMKFTASAATFRAVVQELTGKHSDIADVLARQPAFEPSPPSRPAAPLRGARFPRPPPPDLAAAAAGAGNSFRSMPEMFLGMEEFFPGLLPPSLHRGGAAGGDGFFDGQ